jgi:hypothetical protein
MRRARFLITICCALVVAAVLMVPGVRADEYTKLTYLTFSGPVQVPGVTLPAGTYMFKLADPAGGRRAIQIWDEKGTKMYTMLLTIPDEQLEAKAEPVVLFSERPSGSPHAVKSWFYPAERIGYEFIYPKSQATKIAADANTSVLAYNDEHKNDADENTLRGAQVGRIDAQGQVAADTRATTTTTTTTTAPAQSNTPATAAAQNDPAPSTQPSPATTASANTATATTAPEATSANRTPPSPSAASPTTASAAPTTSSPDRAAAAPTTAAPRTTTAGSNRAVGTSGSQAAQTATTPNELPRTASPLATIQLMSLALIGGALGIRQLRRRFAENR